VLIPTLCLYYTLFACGLAIGLAALRYDLYDREPWYMVLIAVLLGAAAMWIAGHIESAAIRAINAQGILVDNLTLAVLVGCTEEFAKFAVVVLFWAAAAKYFNDPLDGLIYGSFAGLGAALNESVAVLSQSPVTGYLPPQEPVRLAGHLVMGGIGAYGLGLLTTKSKWAIPAIILSLGSAALLHTIWDIAAFSAAEHDRFGRPIEAWHTAVPIAVMLTGMVAYRCLARHGARLMRRHLNVCDVRTRECPAL
jgi:RsiW-degrading membrane proteinase PrsW (M82 family)